LLLHPLSDESIDFPRIFPQQPMSGINFSDRQIKNIDTHHANNLAGDHIILQSSNEQSRTLDPNTLLDIQQRPVGLEVRQTGAVVIACGDIQYGADNICRFCASRASI
jgi:hypothetical protein